MTATSKNLLTYSFASLSVNGVIGAFDGWYFNSNWVAVTVPISTDVTALIGTFTHNGASVEIAGVAQVSGVTPNDFTSNVTLTVIASDGSEQDYTIAVTVSKVTPIQIAQLRRMIAEPTTTTYSDETLTQYIEKEAHIDSQQQEPFDEELGTWNTYWVPTYDLNAAAANIWEEKANLVITKFDFSADGGHYSMSQQYDQMMKQCRHYRSRRMPLSGTLVKSPKEYTTDESWIGNLPESD